MVRGGWDGEERRKNRVGTGAGVGDLSRKGAVIGSVKISASILSFFPSLIHLPHSTHTGASKIGVVGIQLG